MRPFRDETFECTRRYGHKGKHRASWREGSGSRWVEVTIKWRSENSSPSE